jgi:hypothetical protein
LLSRSGERIGYPGLLKPVSARNGAERLAIALASPHALTLPDRPSLDMVQRHSDVVLVSDFLDPPEETLAFLDTIARRGTRMHLLEVADPAEEVFPYAGRTEFEDPETGVRLTAGRAENWGEAYKTIYQPAARRCATIAAARLELRRQPHRPARLRGAGRPAWPADRPARRDARQRDKAGCRLMLGLPLTFAAPAILFGLAALPVIWWLLRLTPPKPRTEVFPPLRLLARVMKHEETPARSPWWLTLLRLLDGDADHPRAGPPVLNPVADVASGDGPLALLVDNGWSTGADWHDRIAAATQLVEKAETPAARWRSPSPSRPTMPT